MQHVHARARRVLAASEALAVDGNVPGPAFGLHENTERRDQLGGENRLANIVIRGVSRRLPALRIGVERPQRLRREATAAQDRPEIVGPREHRGERDQQDRLEREAAPLPRPGSIAELRRASSGPRRRTPFQNPFRPVIPCGELNHPGRPPHQFGKPFDRVAKEADPPWEPRLYAAVALWRRIVVHRAERSCYRHVLPMRSCPGGYGRSATRPFGRW